MAQTLNKLRAQSLKTLPVGRHGDGGGLYVVVSPKGRSFVFIYIRSGKRREMGLGPISIGLATAREMAETARQQLAAGADPLEARRAAKPKGKVPTFAAVARELIQSKAAGWKGSRNKEEWERTLSLVKDRKGKLKGFCQPLLDMPVDQIEVEHILQVLRPIWRPAGGRGNAGIVTARNLRDRLELTFDFAKAAGYRQGENPARWRGNLAHLLPTIKHRKKHLAALPWRDVPAYMKELQASKSVRSLALQFTLLTAVRTAVTMGAVWGEIDMQDGVWSVPASRMKSDEPHRIPLSEPAMAILREMEMLKPERDADSAYVFPGQKEGKPLSPNGMRKQMRQDLEAGKATVHGTSRSSFRDWAADNGYDRDLAEIALAHAIGDQTERAYARSDLLERRRPMMEAWAAFITGMPVEPATAATGAREPAPGLTILRALPGNLRPANAA